MDAARPAPLTYPQLQNLLRIEFARARRYELPLSCLAVQIDRLEHLRDLYGSGARELILGQVMRIVQGQTRVCDAMGRSGDRMVVVLPHTDAEGARVIGERLLKKVQSLSFEVAQRSLEVTVSVGISSYTDPDMIFFDALLKDAEQAVLEATGAGGNTINLSQPAGDGAPA